MIPDEQLDFAACVSSGQVFRFRLEGDVWRGVDGDNLIEARKVSGGWEVSSKPDAEAWRRFLQMEVDLTKVHEQLALCEPRIVPILECMPGLRTLRPARADETLFSFLCTPNNHMSRIVAMANFLASKGEEVDEGHYAFPTLEVIVNLKETELRSRGFGYRGATIPSVASAVLGRGGLPWLSGLAQLEYQQARAELMSLPGIGPKLADCVCLFGLRFDEAVPIDTHVWKVHREWYARGESAASLTPARYEQARQSFVKQFGCLSGWAQQYVFYHRFLSYRRPKS
jgi:N-glycosylase/DNA lyase